MGKQANLSDLEYALIVALRENNIGIYEYTATAVTGAAIEMELMTNQKYDLYKKKVDAVRYLVINT